MSGTTHPIRRRLRIGVLDNDLCALECIVAMVRQACGEHAPDVWACSKPAQAIQECRFGTLRTDIVLVDMALNGLTGAQVAGEIRRHSPRTGIIGITSYEPRIYERTLMRAGAQALLDKSTLRATLADAIAAVADGEPYPADGGFAGVADPAPRPAVDDAVRLTATERRIVTLSLGHMSPRQIAAELRVSPDTVFSHRRNIKNKLGTGEWHDVLDRCRELHIA